DLFVPFEGERVSRFRPKGANLLLASEIRRLRDLGAHPEVLLVRKVVVAMLRVELREERRRQPRDFGDVVVLADQEELPLPALVDEKRRAGSGEPSTLEDQRVPVGVKRVREKPRDFGLLRPGSAPGRHQPSQGEDPSGPPLAHAPPSMSSDVARRKTV